MSSMNRLCTELANVDWNLVKQNHKAQDSYSVVHDILKEHYDKCFPVKSSKSVHRNRKPWLTPALKKVHAH